MTCLHWVSCVLSTQEGRDTREEDSVSSCVSLKLQLHLMMRHGDVSVWTPESLDWKDCCCPVTALLSFGYSPCLFPIPALGKYSERTLSLLVRGCCRLLATYCLQKYSFGGVRAPSHHFTVVTLVTSCQKGISESECTLSIRSVPLASHVDCILSCMCCPVPHTDTHLSPATGPTFGVLVVSIYTSSQLHIQRLTDSLPINTW